MKFSTTLIFLLFLSNAIYSQNLVQANQDRMMKRIQAISMFGEMPGGGISRLAYSESDIQGRAYVLDIMKALGLEITIDAAGNILARRKGKNPGLPYIAFGSHIDSVPEGGRYDGVLGVISALECVELMNENNIVTEHPLEVIVFTDEEGGLIGSKAMLGTLSPEEMERTSNSGKLIKQGIQDIGGNIHKLETAKRKPEEFEAFLELHIEQGAILESEKINIGVVEGIVGIEWWQVTISGKANHAGTTPMNKRKDALLAAARFIVEVNETARSIAGRQVATVGEIRVEPGASNVVPGEAVLSLEIRDLSRDKIFEVFDKIKIRSVEIGKETGTDFSIVHESSNIPAILDPEIQDHIAQAAKKLDLNFKYMPSGAGHDAQDMAKLAPTGMIFVPSKGGVSHAPQEFTSPTDVANGASVLYHTILRLDHANSLKK